MRRSDLALVVLFSLSTTALGAAALLSSRVPYPPLLEKLKAAGGDPVKVVVIHGIEDLAALKPTRRYKYVVRRDGFMVVAPRPLDEPNNEYVHPILARGEPVRTAGVVHVEHRGAQADDELVFIDQDSKAYCPTFDSLQEVRLALSRVNIARDHVRLEDHPPTCAPLPSSSPPAPPDGGAP